MEEIALPAGRRAQLWTPRWSGPAQVVGAQLTVTPTTHLATLLANWQTILSALRSYLD